MHTALYGRIKHDDIFHVISYDIASNHCILTVLSSQINCNNLSHHQEYNGRLNFNIYNTFNMTVYLITLYMFLYLTQ